MRIIQLQFYVLSCCQAVLADQLTDLGSNVTINCDLDINEVYWILQKTADPPVVILRSFSTPISSTFYLNKTFRMKYSVQFKHRLVINNITADELGVYFCMNTDTAPKFSNSTRIYTNEVIESHNHTVVELTDSEKDSSGLTNWQLFFIISGVLNGLLVMVVIGLVKVVVGNRRSAEQSQLNPDLQQTQETEQHQDPEQLQYSTMDFSKLRRHFRSSQVNSTYAAINLQKS